MHSLPVFLRVKGRPVMLIGSGAAAEAKRRLLERAGALIVGEEAKAALALVACADATEAEAAAARLKARGILVNVTDRPDLCDFTMPAIVDRDPVLIAVGTGGASAGLAKAVRQRIERLLPSGLGALADALHGARDRMRARWPDARARRAALDAALAEGGPLDPARAADGAAVARWLEAADDAVPARAETIELHSVDPDELSLRAARLLGEADLILHDPAVAAGILARARADAVMRPLGSEEAGQDRPGLTVILTIRP
jgi:uroporphyrin-III C-methyltransferase/precorrin-2 dehydrogenase/sirohydrochlorin ferrochelatase